MNKLVILLLAGLFVASLGKHVSPKHVKHVKHVRDLEESEDEEEKPKENPKFAKVLNDVATLEPEVKALHNKDATKNLASIKTDAESLKSATGARATHLREAMKDRVKALRLQLEENDKPAKKLEENSDSENEEAAAQSDNEKSAAAESEDSDKALEENSDSENEEAAAQSDNEQSAAAESEDSEKELEENSDSENEASDKALEEEHELEEKRELEAKHARELEEEKVAARQVKAKKVVNDVDVIRAELKKSTYPKAIRKEIMGNLDQIVADAQKYAKTGNSNIKEALNLRLQALEEETGSKKTAQKSKTEDQTAQKAKTVLADITAVRNDLKEKHLSKKAKKDVLKNLEAMETDAKKLSSADKATFKRLSKAIGLRSQALEEQLA